MSRFFDWAAKWKRFEKSWAFLKRVYKSWQLSRGNPQRPLPSDGVQQDEKPDQDPKNQDKGADEKDEACAGAEEEDAPQVQSRGRARKQQDKFFSVLKELQKNRHTLDICTDLLWDPNLKPYAQMHIGFA